ncbi:hypothetical protein BU23DRAFT_596674 [Bimuria novae-zelandiae CBS 107.79]|uniref:MYND-type domain-containing protein n=1 Tax=Bimuria novae-zelandiae CBS 107.79 TaxID=1447943 RepID=A0A6A5VKJ9_9PLEO|nr:hypothetical protein BU23DRAFT_596674 [Bimuria novae-zelandiae CBS 107.79]
MAPEVAKFLNPPLCANSQRTVDDKLLPCENEAPFVCSGCQFVQYCSTECQQSDRKHHKVNCKSAFMTGTWVPAWLKDKRKPAFVDAPDTKIKTYGPQNDRQLSRHQHCFQAAHNGGTDRIVNQVLNLLFAASGDIGNIVKTVRRLPKEYQGNCTMVCNDNDFQVNGRNVILLMTVLHFEPEVSTPIMIHLWMFNPEQVDIRDRNTLAFDPAQRETLVNFRRTGVLLPFGCSTKEFTVPNPWPLGWMVNPLHGWDEPDYMKHAQVAKADHYGALFFFLRSTLQEFCVLIRNMNIKFRVYNRDASTLPQVEKLQFDRIEISSLCDESYWGPETAIRTFGPMLKSKHENPSATLLFLFLSSAVNEMEKLDFEGQMHAFPLSRKKILWELLSVTPGKLNSLEKHEPQSVAMAQCSVMLFNFDRLFQPMHRRVIRSALENGLRIKNKHTIVKPWPWSIFDSSTKDEFNMMRRHSRSGAERYMELQLA